MSRRCLAKWYCRWKAEGPVGLLDRSTAPHRSPSRTAADVEDLVAAIRRSTKSGPARIAAELKREHQIVIAHATVHRILVRRGLNRLRDLDTTYRRSDARDSSVRARRAGFNSTYR